ncbi:MAG TPA: phosphatidylglycerophosphatase A [Casimicrobiaceae bacterium]|jgi:phosphatidylglycerophosphatase A|nr:phosphatidylglycerophosphatase A [Casimicrobiaceae bacterium]
MRRAPTLRFLFSHPAHFIALGFGTGLSPIAPGTVGTLLALPLAALLRALTGDLGFLLAVAAAFAIGVWAAQRTGRDLGVADHGAIVWDEVAAFLLVLFFVGSDPLREGFAFLLFRFFDIVKPPPARLIDREWHHGFGVMADDIVAAFYALLVFALWQRVFA